MLTYSRIFWFLLILSGAFFVPFALFLPETCRNVVGDGSIPPPWPSANISDWMRFRSRARNGLTVDQNKMAQLRKNYKLTIPNPIGTLRVLGDFETTLILLPAGLAITCFYAIATGASIMFGSLYGFNELEVSLMFLPLGAGSIVSAFTTGKLVDWNYRRHAKRLNFPVVKNRQTDLSDFPVELARLQIGLPLMLFGAVAIIGYGWMMNHKISLAGPIIMLFILGYCIIAGFQCLQVLMVDIYPGQPAVATAANNLFRCLLGAAGSAAIIPMADAMGYGWAYTILALLFFVTSTGSAASMVYGVKWRKQKKEKAERRQQRKDEKKAMKQKQNAKPPNEQSPDVEVEQAPPKPHGT